MADDSLGLKARGVCLTPLLGYGIPANQTVDCIIKDIDGQLSENQSRLKECVLELMELSQNVSGMSEKFTHPTEAVSYIAENRLFDKEMCFDLDSEAVTKLLQRVLQMMEKNPGCEEKVLKQLFELCATEGIAIPYLPSGSGGVSQSVVSINTAVDASEQLSEKLWNDICVKMRQYYSEELKKLPAGEEQPAFSLMEGRAIHCVQSLCSLISQEKAWSVYHNIRVSQLSQRIKNCVNLSAKSKKSTTIGAVVEQFSTLVRSILFMMSDDFELFSSNVFAGVISCMTALSEIYSDALSDVISGITSQLLEELDACPVAKSLKANKRKKDDKEMPKSPSDMGFLGQFKVGIVKPQSKSADNLLDNESEQFSDLQVFPEGYLQPIVKFIEQLLMLSCHIDNLHNALVWQVLGHPPQKTKGKGALKSVLKVSTTNQGEELKKQAFSPRSFEKSGLLPEAIPPPFGATVAMMGHRSVSVNAEDVMVFEWRKYFTRLAPDLAKSIESHIGIEAEQAQKQLDDFITKHTNIEMIRVSDHLIGGRLDYPVMVAKCVHDLLAEIKWLLPLAKAGPQAPFHLVRSSFINGSSVSLKNILGKLETITNGVGSKLPYSCLYCILATLAYVRNQILSLEAALDNEQNSDKKAFPVLYSQYCQRVDALSKQIIEMHNSLVVTSILHDAESNFWQDSKDFYEGERCSFSVHMWYSHLMALKSDLWASCPPKLSQAMFTAVLQESLSLLCNRYAQIKPSFRRTPQFRADITAILLCSSELLYYGTSSVVKYLDPVHTHQEYYNIHVYCSMLLAALVVVTAPIDHLYKVYKKGFKKKHSHSDEDNYKGYVSHWLSWIQPSLFPQGIITADNLQTTSAMYLQLKLLLTKSEPSWVLLLQSLLTKDYALPIMILSRVAMQHADQEVDTLPASSSADTDSNEQSVKEKTEEKTIVREVFSVFVTVILHCTDFTNAFAKIMIPIFERSHSWDVFDVKYMANKMEQLPPWLSAICQSLQSFILRVISPGVHVILARHNEPVGIEPIALHLKQLPCGCPTIHEPRLGNRVLSSTTDVVAYVMQSKPNSSGNKDILAEALYSTVMQLVEDVYTLPASIVLFFKAAQRQAAEHGIHTPHCSLGIKILALSLKLYLSDIKYIESLLGKCLDSELSDQLKMLAECVYHVLCAECYGKGSGTPRLAGMFMKANRNWVSDQIDVLIEHFNDEHFDMEQNEPLHDVPVEFSENLLISQISAILSLEKGEESLRKVYYLISNNYQWILSQLDVTPILDAKCSPLHTSLKLSLDPPAPEDYNPLREYRYLGDVTFDQVAVMNFSWDWSALLQGDLGLSQAGFRSLLFNRHEMQDNAYLEDNEKKAVESLRRKFHADSTEI